MEKRLNKKAEVYISGFKDNIKEKATQMGMTKNDQINTLLQYIYDYERLCFTKEDFQKRFEIYKQNTQQILEIDQTTLTSNHRPNFMSDFTDEEKKVLFGFEPPKKKPSAPNNLI